MQILQDTDGPVRILKENAIFLSIYAFDLTKQYVHQNFHSSNLLTEHQYLNMIPEIERITIDQSTLFLLSQNISM